MNLILGTYRRADFSSFKKQYESVPSGLLGVSVTEYIDSAPLYDFNNNVIGTIQFNNIVKSTVTFPSFSSCVENISIILNDGTKVFTMNQFNGNDGPYYQDGDKFILPIIETLGNGNLGKSGYVVIDAFETTRNVYIKLE